MRRQQRLLAAADALEVINTCGWTRSGLVTASVPASGKEVIITDSEGKEMQTQILANGSSDEFIAKLKNLL